MGLCLRGGVKPSEDFLFPVYFLAVPSQMTIPYFMYLFTYSLTHSYMRQEGWRGLEFVELLSFSLEKFQNSPLEKSLPCEVDLLGEGSGGFYSSYFSIPSAMPIFTLKT